jgi:hypothetical protein
VSTSPPLLSFQVLPFTQAEIEIIPVGWKSVALLTVN